MRELHLHELISQSLDEELSAEEYKLLHAHLQRCDACRSEWSQLRALDALLKQEPPAAPSPAFAPRVMAQVHARDSYRATRRFVFGLGAVALASALGLAVIVLSVLFYPALWTALLDVIVSGVTLTATLAVVALDFVRVLQQVLGAGTLFALTLFALALTAVWSRVAFGSPPFARPIPITEV